jgi:transposase
MAAFSGAALISKEVFVEIHVYQRQGMSLRKIAAEVGVAVNTVRRHLAAESAPQYVRKVKGPSKLEPHKEYLRQRQQAAYPNWIPATVLQREIAEQGYTGGLTKLRAFLRTLRPTPPADPVVRFETMMGQQLQVDWVEFRKGGKALYAFCATLGYSRASYVEFVDNMKVESLIGCHERAFAALGGVPRSILYDNMKTVILERDAHGEGEHRFHAGFLDFSKHCGFAIKVCRPFRAKTKGKVERFNGYLRRSFYVPLASRLSQGGQQLDVTTANIEVSRWLREVANVRQHGTTGEQPAVRLLEEIKHLQALPPPWRGAVAAARPQPASAAEPARPASVKQHIETSLPQQHTLQPYQQLLDNLVQGAWA